MELLITLFGILVIHTLALISPGPDFIIVVKNALTYGRKSGIWTSVGIALAILVHITYCFFGLALIISQSVILFNIFKVLGGLYLIYIGWKSLKSSSSGIDIQAQFQKNIPSFQSFKIGFLTNLLNPKATLYFLSLFTFVIKPDTGLLFIIIMSLLMLIVTFAWFVIVTIFFTLPTVQKKFSKFEDTFNKLFGALLIHIGLRIIEKN